MPEDGVPVFGFERTGEKATGSKKGEIPAMKDQYGRQIDYMRISVTDRCNLRCIYCMPQTGVEPVSHGDILTFDEIARVSGVAAGLGICRIRLTGGEPLVRKDLAELVEMLREIPGIEEIALTTNGVLLKEQLRGMLAAGIRAVNISLDTLDDRMYAALTRRDALPAALEGLHAAVACPELKVKVNCVPMKGINEEQWVPLAGLAKDQPVDVRFIEMMPVGLGRKYPAAVREEVLERLREAYGLEKWDPGVQKELSGNGPAQYAHFEGFTGKIGFISALSHKFCSDCNRIRLTAEGFLKPCLQYAGGEDLRKLLRSGYTDEELRRVMERAIYGKPACHHFEEREPAGAETAEMFRIGG